jgi:gamma-D-glutamyl-L-lysine dipeptidyl-peptidase
MKFVQCLVCIANVKTEASHESELYTQLLYGYKAKVIEVTNDRWVKINFCEQDHEGFVLRSQVGEINELQFQENYTHITTSFSFELIHEEHKEKLFTGSCINPSMDIHSEGTLLNLKDITLNDAFGKKILFSLLHAPYMWGGLSQAGIDCTGLSKLFYSFLKLNLPHNAKLQMKLGDVVDFTTEIQFGDVAFFINEEEEIHHVGILLSEHEIIHASEVNGCVAIDHFDQEGIINKVSGKRTHKLRLIKRFHSGTIGH